ncbi:MAG: hypothetical protein NDF52_05585 [archaeon YNP-WB-062]|nr:hypothetical protein [Candidatus Culexarchaeum yellowstonense]
MSRMVEIVDDWNALMEHSRYCKEVLYKVTSTPEGVRLRVRVGKFGYDKVLPKPEAEEKINYLKMIGAVKVSESVPDAFFFVG